eukprot:TRINITY_DN5603_c0_g1_i1.p1 TRINITY_DN5603_c0_g1~~TRINITY_DN5603_c0_g1_i1.p1  ORF type:complete len:454 (+),score=119.08 TRINITY_DN5603_c0_g1_i1:82-1362(+)
MAGTVGGAVAGSPGYQGYVPSFEQPPACANSHVTQRLPVGSRRIASQPTKGHLSPLNRSGPRSPADAVPSAQPPADPSAFFLPKRLDNATLYNSESTRGALREPDEWEYPKTKTALLEKTSRKVVRGPLPVPFTATTLNTVQQEHLDRGKDPNFFSRVRKEEWEEDHQRLTESGGKATRTSAKECAPSHTRLKKRMMPEGSCAPPKGAFVAQERRPLLGADPVAPGEYVKFKGMLSTETSSQLEYGVRGSNPQERMGATARDLSAHASTGDLLRGTPKQSDGLRIPGYVGHVPQHQDNLKKVKKDEHDDLVRMNSRNMIMMTSAGKTMSGYAGFEPKSIYNDTGKPNRPPAAATSSGGAAERAATGPEAVLNANEYGKTQGVRKFFSQGTGSADHVISDQYFMRYRPMEGMLKMGPPADRNIPIVR